MSAVTDTIRNDVDTEQLFATLDLIKAGADRFAGLESKR